MFCVMPQVTVVTPARCMRPMLMPAKFCSYFQWSSVLRDWYDDQKVFYDLATGTCNTANPPNIAGTCSDYETVSLRIQLS